VREETEQKAALEDRTDRPREHPHFITAPPA
jgi:hypothetical protein